MATSTQDWIEELKSISVLELSERIKALEEEFGVSATAVAAAAPAGAEKPQQLVDGLLIRGLDAFELQAHSHPAIAPRDARLGFDVHLRAGQSEAGADFRSLFERAHRADRDASLAQVERERGGDGVTESIRDRDAEDDARAAAAVEVVGEEVRRERGQDVLNRTVFVHVPGDAE